MISAGTITKSSSMSSANFWLTRIFWLESQNNVKIAMFAIKIKRLTWGTVKDRFKSLSGSKNQPLAEKDDYRVFILNASCIQSFYHMSSTHQESARLLSVSSSTPKNARTLHHLHVFPLQPSWLFLLRLKFPCLPRLLRFYVVLCRLFLKDSVDMHKMSWHIHEKRRLPKLVSGMFRYIQCIWNWFDFP